MQDLQFRGFLSKVGAYRFTETPGSIPSNGSVAVTETVAGVVDSDFVLAEVESASGVQTDVWVSARANGANTVRVIYRNEGVGAENPGTVVVRLIVLRLAPGAIENE